MVQINVLQGSGKQPGPCMYNCSAVVGNKFYLLLGLKANKSENEEVYEYDLEKQEWKLIKTRGKPPSHRCLASAVAIGRKIYVFGGYQITSQGTHKCFNGMYTFDTTTYKWQHLDCNGLVSNEVSASMQQHF